MKVCPMINTNNLIMRSKFTRGGGERRAFNGKFCLTQLKLIYTGCSGAGLAVEVRQALNTVKISYYPGIIYQDFDILFQ